MMWKNAIQRLWDKNRIKKCVSLAVITVAFAGGFFSAAEVKATVVSNSEYYTESTTATKKSNLPSTATRISNSCFFDPQTSLYYTSISGFGEAAIEANVCDGMYVQNAVKIKVLNGIVYDVYKDGLLLENYSGEDLVEPGSYSLSVHNNNGKNEIPMSFTIIGTSTNNKALNLPNNCKVLSVTKDDANMNFSGNRVELTEGGKYVITYQVNGVSEKYKLKLSIDTVPPVLALAAVGEDGRARGIVDISDLEEKCEIYITLDGEPVSYRKELTAPGNYRILLIDEAGNQTVYNFTILIYFNSNSILVFVMLLLTIVGTIGYMIYVRKHLRVR